MAIIWLVCRLCCNDASQMDKSLFQSVEMARQIRISCPYCRWSSGWHRIRLGVGEGKPYILCPGCSEEIDVSRFVNEWAIATASQRHRWLYDLVMECGILVGGPVFVAMLYLVSWLNVEWTTLLGWLIFFFSLAVALLVVVIRVHRIARRSIQRLRSNDSE